jgi:cytochrome P450
MVEAVATMEADTAVHSRDIFSDRNLADSRALFRKLRDLGDAVWIADLELYVVARYKDVVAALRAPDKLVSSQGVSVNPDQNAASGTMSSTILSDGDKHRRLQRAVMKPLTPSALAQLQDRVARLANGRVVMNSGR